MYLIADVPQNVTDALNKVIAEKNFQKAQHDLAGNIRNEFLIPDGKPYVFPFLFALINEHSKKYPNFWQKITGMQRKKEFTLELFSLWVNFQKKHEFNPVHVHDGLYSFVIWHKIPYKMEDEIARFPDMKKEEVRAGYFSFLGTNEMGRIQTYDLPVDNSWQGKMALFPADLNHQVYPFYTSDEERITISGNIGFQ